MVGSAVATIVWSSAASSMPSMSAPKTAASWRPERVTGGDAAAGAADVMARG